PPPLSRSPRPRDRRLAHGVPRLRACRPVQPAAGDRAAIAGTVAGGVRAEIRRAPRRGRLPELLLSLQPAARSGRVLRRRPRSPSPARDAREVLSSRRRCRRRPDRSGARAIRAGVPRSRPARGLPARPDLAGLSPPLSASLGRRALQAAAALPALDGPPRITGLWPLDLDLAGAALDAGGHERQEHQPVVGPHR